MVGRPFGCAPTFAKAPEVNQGRLENG